jgi:hypothetical protein
MRRKTAVRNDVPSRRELKHRNDISAGFGHGRSRSSPGRTHADGARPPRGARARRLAGRLGPVEWALLTVIILAVVITAAMAIINPS